VGRLSGLSLVKPWVAGSSPAMSTIRAHVAQLAEQREDPTQPFLHIMVLSTWLCKHEAKDSVIAF